MTDFGVDAPWLRHEPWDVPEPFTPEAGEIWSKEDIDTWVAVVRRSPAKRARTPDLVRNAPHRRPSAR